MRRFCNFWMILFNVRGLKPFSQFIKQEEFKELKLRITAKVNELLACQEHDMRGKLERCVSKISEFSQYSQREILASPHKSPGGRPRITREMLHQAKESEIEPEQKISNFVIKDNQEKKSRQAFHYNQRSAGGVDSQSQRSSIRSKNFVVHPDQDKDIKPLGLYEPHKGITRAH